MSKPITCQGCPLFERGQGFARTDGTGINGVLLLGEALGESEAERSLPFQGDAGYLLNQALHRLALKRADFLIGNTVCCRPPNNWLEGAPWEALAIDHCDQYLVDTLTSRPDIKVIVPMGNTGLRKLLGVTGIKNYHGSVAWNQRFQRWVVPSLHPSYVLRTGWKELPALMFDITRALNIVRDGGFDRKPVDYLEDPSPNTFAAWAEEFLALPHDTLLGFDIETDISFVLDEEDVADADHVASEIVRISFSYKPQTAVSVPFTAEYLPTIRRLLASPHDKCSWNGWAFDLPKLRHAGFACNGMQIDSMIAWHVFRPDMPRGLGYVAPFFCLEATSRVRLVDGTSLKISDIVTKKMNVPILGMDLDGRPATLRIIDWHRQKVDNQKWLSITSTVGTQPIKCTPDHRIWIDNSRWVEAKDVKVGDEITSFRKGNNDVIHGTLLGDGCVAPSGYLSFSHCQEQEDWCRKKANVFGITPKLVKGSINSYSKGREQWRAGIGVGKYWATLFYDENRKKNFIPPPSIAALAVWYCDDGTLASSGNGPTYNPRIFIAGFKDTKPVYKWFEERFGDNISAYSVGTHSECVTIRLAGADVFFNAISPWVPPSMYYKLPPRYRGFYNGWLDKEYFQQSKVIAATEYNPTKWSRRKNVRYCITVDDPSHRFFTSGGLVSNCDVEPWKHTSHTAPAKYSCVDSDVLLRITLALKRAMEADGSWSQFIKNWVLLQPRLEAISHIGIGIDEGMRRSLEAKYEEIRDNVTAKIQEFIPDTLKNRRKQKDGGYKGKPKDVREYIKSHSVAKDEEASAWLACGYQQFDYRRKNDLGEEEIYSAWDALEPFNPNSPQQIIKYITATYGRNAVPTNKRTGAPTTELAELKRLAKSKRDRVLEHIIEAGEADSHISSFVRPWAPGPDGRIHARFTNAPATCRLASEGPNVQNFPSRSAEAKIMRQMIIPGDGYEWIWEADYKSIEAILVGIYANDPDYTRIAYLGIHDFMAGNKLGLNISPTWSDADLKIALKEAKKLGNTTKVPGTDLSVRNACKVSVHGGNYLEGALLLHKTYPELFPKVRDAEEYQDFYFGLFPKIPVWQQDVINTVYDTGYIQNKWNIKRWFWYVKRWAWVAAKKKWELKPADDAKKAVATNPQSSAGLIMRGSLVGDEARELIDRRSLMISIHDSWVGRSVNRKDLDYCLELAKRGMEYSIPELGNIVIPVEMKVGKNWATMEEI